jgi:hypothetical protein
MTKIRVARYTDSEELGAELEISCGEGTLLAFAYPFRGIESCKEVSLFAFGTSHVIRSDEWHPPRRMENIYYGHQLCAEVVDVKNRLVQIGDVVITLDTSIDSDIPVGAWVCFQTLRLDY